MAARKGAIDSITQGFPKFVLILRYSSVATAAFVSSFFLPARQFIFYTNQGTLCH